MEFLLEIDFRALSRNSRVAALGLIIRPLGESLNKKKKGGGRGGGKKSLW